MPGSVQEIVEGGIPCHGLEDLVVLSQRLYSLILEVFSDPNDSVILRAP